MRTFRPFLAVFLVLLPAFVSAPVSAASKGAVPGEKKHCLTTKVSRTASFPGSAGGSPTGFKYTITVAPKVCLLYVDARNIVAGRRVTQPRVIGYRADVKVSHSGRLPANPAGTHVLFWSPTDGKNSWPYRGTATAEVAKLDKGTDGRFDVVLAAVGALGVEAAAEQAFASLLEAGFKCSKTGCRPAKASALSGLSGRWSPLEGDVRYVLHVHGFLQMPPACRDEGQERACVGGELVSNSALSFWDHGTPSVVREGVSRSQNTIKREKFGIADAWCGEGVFMGVPAANRSTTVYCSA